MEALLMERVEWKVANQLILCIPATSFLHKFISRLDRPLEEIENMEMEEPLLEIINFILYSIRS